MRKGTKNAAKSTKTTKTPAATPAVAVEVSTKAKAPKVAKPKKVSGLDAAAQVLKNAGKPIRCKEIVETMLGSRLKEASFPTLKDLDTYDFTAIPFLSKPKILELARGQWIDEKFNACFIGNAGTGKTHLAITLGHAACRQHKRVRFFTAATLVNTLEEAQKQYRLERLLASLDRVDLLIVDELGYLSFSRSGAELLFQVFADRYERGSILITSNLPFGEWGQILQGERMTAALLDRFTHRCHIFEMNGKSFRFKESSKQAKEKKTAKV